MTEPVCTEPAAVAQFVAVVKSVTDAKVTGVYDGPTVTGAKQQEAVNVAYAMDGGPTIEGVYTDTAAYTGQDYEAFTIHNRLIVQVAGTGADTAAKARARAYALLAVIKQAVADDPQLDRLVMKAKITASALVPDQTPQGARATLPFDLTCTSTNP